MTRAATIHLGLGPGYFDAVEAAKFPKHVLRYRNDRWARAVGLADLNDDAWVQHFGAFTPLPDNLPQPLALRYHGHQFRSYNPDIGDGRGFLFAQLRADDGRVLDLGTKGSGLTPYSRRGDGRLTLKGGVRELLATTMLEAFGVNTSKTFSLIETGEDLIRSDEPSPTRSSVLVRLSHSNIRIGTFQRLAYEQDGERIQKLVDHVLAHYFGDIGGAAPAMLQETVRRVARTGAQWMAAGFVHGVLNTDNINITGESFDYGPYRFLPTYDPSFTAAYFDQTGLYAYGRQPGTLMWNLQRLAECLTLVAEKEPLVEALQTFPQIFETEMAAAVLARLNLAPRDAESDLALTGAVFEFLHATQMPFEQFFFDCQGAKPRAGTDVYRSEAFAAVRDAFAPYTPLAAQRLAHPYFAQATPETLLIDEIESLWAAIAERDDWAPLYAKVKAIERAGQAYGNMP